MWQNIHKIVMTFILSIHSCFEKEVPGKYRISPVGESDSQSFLGAGDRPYCAECGRGRSVWLLFLVVQLLGSLYSSP